jgi:hypothetical protein
MRLINHLSHVNYVIPSLPKDIDMKLHVAGINSLTPKSVPVGTKLVLFGRYVLNIYVGIV